MREPGTNALGRACARGLTRLLPLVLAASAAACENESPAALEEDVVPVGPVTLEVRLPWSQFAANLKVLGGFGSADQVGLGFLANQYQGTLDVRTLLHLDPFPAEATVNDSTGTQRTDTQLSFIGGRLMVRFDADASTNAGPVTVSVGRTLTRWDPRTATWTLAADSVGGQRPWGEPGGGPVRPLGAFAWNKSAGDSILIPIDSAGVAALNDTTSDRGVRLALDTPGERLQIKFIQMEILARPSVKKDTVITLTSQVVSQTFIYTPAPPPPTSGLRVGGIPAWRSIFTLALPQTLPGTAALCARVTCPLQLSADRITHAGLVLTTRPVEAPFRPSDSLGVQARSVIAPEVLPKSPIGDPLFVSDIGRTIGASVPFAGFAAGTPAVVEVPLTPLVHDVVRGQTASGAKAPNTVALLSLRCPAEITTCSEARSLTYAAFAGPGQTGEPVLRLVLTVSGKLELP